MAATAEDVFASINVARTNPAKFERILSQWRSCFAGNLLCLPGQLKLATNEGVAAVDEALAFLRSTKPVPALQRISPGMSAAATRFCADIGPKGMRGHTGSDGSSPYDRISRHGKWSGSAAENIAYGMSEAEEVVASWIVDDGVASRGHRNNIFKREFTTAGVGIGAHKDFGSL